jgi:NAD(P)-dependent dehydrogenase (short-subunit alcohol dehydrogenase family)
LDLGLINRRALVTGASRGIGRAIAEALAGEGCALAMVARDSEGLETARQEIAAKHDVSIDLYPCDLSDPAAQKRLAAASGEVEILINNAGAVPGGEIEEVSEEQWGVGWSLKVHGYINLTRLYYPAMKRRGCGVIINIIGMAGERPNARVIAITSGNAALISFTRALGGCSPDFGVRVVGINPSATSTERAVTLWKKQAQTELGDAACWPELVESLPFGRATKPEEIADLAVFLASDRAGYISGTVVNVDGGQSWR